MVTQISQQDLRGVFAPLFAESNVEVPVETVASSGWLEGEEAEIKIRTKLESEKKDLLQFSCFIRFVALIWHNEWITIIRMSTFFWSFTNNY